MKESEIVTDERGRPVVILYQNGQRLKYHMGSDARGIIMEDCGGEYIKVGSEKRYWRGIIDPLPRDSILWRLQEFGFVMLKPDALARGLYLEILTFLKEQGFRTVGERVVLFSRQLVYKMYPFFIGQELEDGLVRYLTSELSSCFLVKGDDVIDGLLVVRQRIRELHGASPMTNLIHCSDSRENAIREALLIFEIDEIVDSVGLKF